MILGLGGLVATQAEFRFPLPIHKANDMMSRRLFIQGPGGWLCYCLRSRCQNVTAFGLDPLRGNQYGLKIDSHLFQLGLDFLRFALLNNQILNVFVQSTEQMVSALPVFIRGSHLEFQFVKVDDKLRN